VTFRRSIFLSASEDRLQNLIEERLAPGADKTLVDRRLWDLFGEQWCIMATDLVGFSRGVAEFGITHFLQTIYESERLLVPVVERHDGIMLKMEGDSFLVIFRNVDKAILAAIEMQRTLRAYNDNKSDEEHVLLGVGLGFGRVLRIGDADVFGAEVNAACILGEDVSRAYDILVTKAVRDAVTASDVRFEELDEAPPGTDKAYRLAFS
jgi:adenylate cyclase